MSSAVVLAAFVLLGGGAVADGVVISEVHYHPPVAAESSAMVGSGQDKSLEFVELFNSGPSPVDLSGWSLDGAVQFAFPDGLVLDVGAYVVVARRVARLREVFGLGGPESGTSIIGNFEGTLDNGRDRLIVVDAFNAYVDSLHYEDGLPWPEEADGDGASLQRVCAQESADRADNWVGLEPTPLGSNPAEACPLPVFQQPLVAINEIYYHPRRPEGILAVGDDGESLEFVELRNTGSTVVNLRGWSFSDGISFSFPDDRDVLLPPTGYLVVARDEGALREAFAVSNVVGDFDGSLRNSGERLTLVDAVDSVIDSVRYDDGDDGASDAVEGWSHTADGLGFSLERMDTRVSAQSPANWRASQERPGRFRKLSGAGKPRGTPLERFVISVNGPGEYLVDNVVLENVAEPGVNLVSNGSFDANLDGWLASGTAMASTWAPGEGMDGSGALRVLTTEACPFDLCGTAHAVVFQLPVDMDRDATYRVSADVKLIGGRPSLFFAGIFGGASAAYTDVATPGEPNSAAADIVSPSISDIRRYPQEPTSNDTVWITAHVPRGGGALPMVTLFHNDGVPGMQPIVAAPMLDDGLNRDGVAGDGVYGVSLPPFPHNTQLRFFVAADDGIQVVESPIPVEVGMRRGEEVWGYYVNDLQTNSELPAYHILLDGVEGNRDAVNTALNCFNLKPGSFAHRGDLYPDVGVRFRGNTMCIVDKRNFKIRFNDGRLFEGLRKLNFNSMWTDKALVREQLSWDLLRDLDLPHSEIEYARLNVSGTYYGLYICLEHPDERFLERNGLDSEGSLYKAEQPSQRDMVAPVGVSLPALELEETYQDLWEEETNEGRDYSDLAEFIDAMHADGLPPGPSADFWETRSFPEMIIGYQVGQVVLNNFDSFAKNHFLYHDFDAERWGFLAWDLDLSFGKFFTLCAVSRDEGRQVGTLNDILLCDTQPNAPAECQVPNQTNPWFAASVENNVPRNWVVEFFFNAGGGFYQRAYLKRLWDVLTEKYRRDVYSTRLDALAASLAEEAEEDYALWGRYPTNVPGYPDDMLSNIEIVKDQVACHGDFLRTYVNERHAEIPLLPRVKITEILYRPEFNLRGGEFLELRNFGETTVDLSGWSVDGIGYVFPPESSVAAGETFVVAESPDDFRENYTSLRAMRVFGPYDGRLSNGGETLRLLDAGPGYPATIDLVHYRDGGEWPELLPGQSLELTDVRGDRDNDRPENWRASSSLGGTPGSTFVTFVRGDANSDGRINLQDPLVIVNFLFVDGRRPRCLDAVDVDDSGRLLLTDAIYLLTHLFQRGADPPQPYPEAGQDQTLDSLSCLE